MFVISETTCRAAWEETQIEYLLETQWWFNSIQICLEMSPAKQNCPLLRCNDWILRRTSPTDTWVTSECHCCGETPRRGLNSSVRTSALPSSACPPSALMSPLALVSAIRDGKRNNFILGVDEVNCLVDGHLALSCWAAARPVWHSPRLQLYPRSACLWTPSSFITAVFDPWHRAILTNRHTHIDASKHLSRRTLLCYDAQKFTLQK